MTPADRDELHRRSDRSFWFAYWLGAVVLLATMFAVGSVVQRYQLRNWERKSATVVTVADRAVGVRYVVDGEPREEPMRGWRGAQLQVGKNVELWHHPRNSAKVILTSNTPLNSLPLSLAIGLPAGALGGWLLRRSTGLRRAAQPAAIDSPAPLASRSAADEWLGAAAVPLLVALVSLGWLAANPEIQGDTQLGLAGVMYLAATFGLHRWRQAQRAVS